jgi:lipoate-protein ligase A
LSYDRAPELGDIRTSYAYILARIRDAHAGVSAEIACAGTSDVACAGRKFSGNSQQRKRRHLLHHGTILYGFDLTLVGRYLRMPLRRPDYRKDRQHVNFLTNLPVEPAEIRRRLRGAWHAKTELPALPQDSMQQLAAEKYSREEWVRRR